MNPTLAHSESRLLRIKPPRIFFGLTSLAFVANMLGSIPFFDPHPRLAILFAGAGVCLLLRAWWIFRLRENPICPDAMTRSLITDDIYRFSRNPMYLGMLMASVGIALAFGSVAFFAASIFLFLILNYGFCMLEEEKLLRTFGRQYSDYALRVGRWM